MTELRFPWESDPAPVEAPPSLPSVEPLPKPRGRRPMVGTARSAALSWLYHHLTISGPSSGVAAFAEAARGSGVIPWEVDTAAVEEDVFNLAVSQPPHRRSLTVEGCRVLARQFRQRVEARQARAAALVGVSRACPFDLHTLLPIPAALLQLGPDHPQALAWLRQNWGTTDKLRQVVERPRPSIGRRLPAGHSVMSYGFFTQGAVPWPRSGSWRRAGPGYGWRSSRARLTDRLVDGHAAVPAEELTQDGEGHTPRLELEEYSGPLDRLLALARDHAFDLSRLSLPAFADQLVAALERDVPLGQKADWVVMAAWLVQLRSRLLLPAEVPAQQAAQAEAGQLRGRLLQLQQVQALAAWLDARPQLGRDVFVRGQPKILGAALSVEHEVDVIEFLWAAMALFDDDLPHPDTAERYRPQWLDLHSIPDARLRIMRLLGECPDGYLLNQLLPEQAKDVDGETETVLKRRSAWTSTFVASLELTKQGDVVLVQGDEFGPIHLTRPAAHIATAQEQTLA